MEKTLLSVPALISIDASSDLATSLHSPELFSFVFVGQVNRRQTCRSLKSLFGFHWIGKEIKPRNSRLNGCIMCVWRNDAVPLLR